MRNSVRAAVVIMMAGIAMPAHSQQRSNTCYFLIGPATGTTRYFGNFAPLAVGAACNDGAGSAGVAVPDSLRNPRGQFDLQGDRPACTDPLGTAVPYSFNANIPKSGLATVSGNVPVIFLKPADFNSFSPPVARFLLAHECGHHALGQVLAVFYYRANIGPREELAADCFAGNALRRLGRMSEGDWRTVATFLETIPGDVANLPGPRRVAELERCIQ